MSRPQGPDVRHRRRSSSRASAQASVPPCSPTGAIPVALAATPTHQIQSVQYKQANGPTQIIPIPEGGGQAQRTVAFPEGRLSFEYWGDFTNDGPETASSATGSRTCSWTRPSRSVAITNPNPFRTFVIKRAMRVDVDATDPLSGLTTDPSGLPGASTPQDGAGGPSRPPPWTCAPTRPPPPSPTACSRRGSAPAPCSSELSGAVRCCHAARARPPPARSRGGASTALRQPRELPDRRPDRHPPWHRTHHQLAQHPQRDPERPLPRWRLPGDPVAQAPGEGTDRAAAQGLQLQALRLRRSRQGCRRRPPEGDPPAARQRQRSLSHARPPLCGDRARHEMDRRGSL